jgi:hypothetical protein
MLVSCSFSSSVIKSDTVIMSLTVLFLVFSRLFKAVKYVVLLVLKVTDLACCCLSLSNSNEVWSRLLNCESK